MLSAPGSCHRPVPSRDVVGVCNLSRPGRIVYLNSIYKKTLRWIWITRERGSKKPSPLLISFQVKREVGIHIWPYAASQPRALPGVQMKRAWVSAALSGVIFSLNGTLLNSGFETWGMFFELLCEQRIHGRGEKIQGAWWAYESSFKWWPKFLLSGFTFSGSAIWPSG